MVKECASKRRRNGTTRREMHKEEEEEEDCIILIFINVQVQNGILKRKESESEGMEWNGMVCTTLEWNNS